MILTISASPAPYRSTRQLTSSSAVAATCGPAFDPSSASSASTRSPAFCASWPAAIGTPLLCPARLRGALQAEEASGTVVLAGLHRQCHTGGRVGRLEHLAAAEVHVHAARQARVEAAHGAHDVDALEVVRRVLLEDRR